MPFVLLFCLQFILAQHAFASDIPVRVREPERKEAQQAEAAKAAQETKKRQIAADAEDVRYEQVLADPDNIDLNYRYARSQVKKGNLKGAMATLERILMIKPDLADARLFYAIVLLEGGNFDAAAREFATLQGGALSDELRAEMNRYLPQLSQGQKKTRLTALVGGGLDYDDNRNAAPASGQRLLSDVPITLDSGSTRKDDVGRIALANIAAVRELGSAGHQLFGSVGYYRAEQTHLTMLNLQNYSAIAGGVYKSHWADWVPSFEFDHLLLAETTYLRNYAFRLLADRKVVEGVDVFAEASYAWQRYNPTDVVPTGDQRTGNRVAGTLGANAFVGSHHRLSASYAAVNQGAAELFDAYFRQVLVLGDTMLLPRGQFLLLSVSSYFDRYIKPEEAISMRGRNDDIYRGTISYGFPLELVTKALSGVLWTATYEYYQAMSTVKNYSYSDNRVSGLLTYRLNWGL